MRNGTWFMKGSIVILVAAIFALAAAVDTSSAAQATGQATDVVTTGPVTPTFAAARFPLCLPARPSRDTASATPGATEQAPATMPAAITPAVAANPTVYIGVYISNVDHCGARVQAVMRNSPARTAGLLMGDVIVAVNGTALGGSSDLLNAVQMGKSGGVLTLTVQRRVRPQRPGRQTATPAATEAAEQPQIALNTVELDIQVTLAPYPGRATPVPIATEAATDAATATP